MYNAQPHQLPKVVKDRFSNETSEPYILSLKKQTINKDDHDDDDKDDDEGDDNIFILQIIIKNKKVQYKIF